MPGEKGFLRNCLNISEMKIVSFFGLFDRKSKQNPHASFDSGLVLARKCSRTRRSASLTQTGENHRKCDRHADDQKRSALFVERR